MQVQQTTVALVGASGLIGTALLPLLCHQYSAVRVITRRPLQPHPPQVREYVVSFADAAALQAALTGCEHVFCAVGTTQKKVQGNMEAYRHVDFDIPVNMAKAAHEVGVRGFWLVSSVGANSRAGNFYLQLKGEVEEAVNAVGLEQVGFFRPSMLLGKRTEKRPAERLGQWLMQALKPL
ncbi:MAG: NAD-dependent epimerase/dehydratase family protein, partial [Bacteroidetes bacterium]